jgi:thiol-disulfide isomerase/thioredoxin
MANWTAMTAVAPPAPSDWLVACLCATWCRTCDGYREVMEEAARRHPGWRFAWVDIEDHADALDDPDGAGEDIEDFPTLLLARRGVAHFFGPLLPHAGVLDRLLAQAAADQLPPAASAAAHRLARAVSTLVDQAPQAVAV